MQLLFSYRLSWFKFYSNFHDQYCAGAKKVYGHKALTYFRSFCVVEVVLFKICCSHIISLS
nr:MAG TPA: hypothetical protein [Caudoviricetes sp.]